MTVTTTAATATNNELDEPSIQLRQEALDVMAKEPGLSFILNKTILAPGVETFDEAVLSTVCFRLLLQNQNHNGNNNNGNNNAFFELTALQALFHDAVTSLDMLEMGWTMSHAIRADAAAVVSRDPAMNTLLEVVLFSKGYAALVCHRVAHRLYHNDKKFTALFLQSQASAVFGVDLHPCCRIGAAVMLDHGTGIVVGETATIGDGTTLLHNVTLGGTGKDHGDRHPKIGKHVLIGCNSSILGNIVIGNCAKIGAGSVVLRSIPPYATAVGAPAKIIGRAAEIDPGSEIDFALLQVSVLHKVPSSVTVSSSTTTQTLTSSSASSSTSNDSNHHHHHRHHNNNNDISSWPKDDLCPFREYRMLAKQAPKGTITICTLGQILAPLGVSSCQVGACFFELDECHVGHVHWNSNNNNQEDTVLTEKLLQITAKYCPNIEPQAVRAVLQRVQQDNCNFHLTDGTDKHRCCVQD